MQHADTASAGSEAIDMPGQSTTCISDQKVSESDKDGASDKKEAATYDIMTFPAVILNQNEIMMDELSHAGPFYSDSDIRGDKTMID